MFFYCLLNTLENYFFGGRFVLYEISLRLKSGEHFVLRIILEKTGTIDHCVIKAGLPYERVKAENGDVLDKVIFMPIVNLHKEGAEKIINDYQLHMKPTAYELVFNDDNEEMLRLIRKVRDSGAKLFINSLWPELCGGHDDDRAVELHQPDDSWGWILNQGAKLIQTDRPALLLEYLRKKKLHD